LSNDPWFTLCRDHVHKCILFLTLKKDVWQIVNSGGLANESIFAIILQTFKELTNTMRTINDSATICDWDHMTSPTSPNQFKEASEENINIICNLLKENKYAMFLRKVHRDFPDNIIKNIMNTDFDHTYELLHNQAKKKHNFYRFINLQNTFILLLVGLYFITRFFTKGFMYQ
jgi:hypothetical protein